jgi:hypothetical protein
MEAKKVEMSNVQPAPFGEGQLSLPEWLKPYVSALIARGEGIKRSYMLPANLALTPNQKMMIDQRLDLLRKAERCDIDASMAAVGELLVQMTDVQLDIESAKIRARGYMTALEDVPAGAVREACRRWLRAEIKLIKLGEESWVPRYAFMPKPPELRLISQPIAELLGWQIVILKRLFDASVLPVKAA